MSETIEEVKAEAIEGIRRRIGILTSTKTDLKREGVQKATRRAMTDGFMRDAVRLVIAERKVEIAEHLMDNPPLHGRDFKQKYVQECEKVFGKEEEG